MEDKWEACLMCVTVPVLPVLLLRMREAVLGSGIIKLLPPDGKALSKLVVQLFRHTTWLAHPFVFRLATKALSVSGGVTKGGNWSLNLARRWSALTSPTLVPGTASAVRFSNCCHVLINRERGGGVQFSYGFRCVKTIVTLRSSGSWERWGGGGGGRRGR